MLGHDQVSWDNDSGRERQPWSSIKSWAQLSANEKQAAELLGYTRKNWDNESGSERQPASASKTWAELTACIEIPNPHAPAFCPLDICLFALDSHSHPHSRHL